MVTSAGSCGVWPVHQDAAGAEGREGVLQEGAGAAGRPRAEHERAMRPCGRGGQQHLGCAPEAAAALPARLQEIIDDNNRSLSPGETHAGQCVRALREQESHGGTGPGVQQRAIKLITELELLHVTRN